MLRARPTQEPQTPAAARNGNSSRELPWYVHARRKRICAKQMDPLRLTQKIKSVPSEEGTQAGECEEPVEYSGTHGSDVDIRQTRK